MAWGGGINRFPYSLSVSSDGALSATISNGGALSATIANGGALRLTIYNPKTNEILYAGDGLKMAQIITYKGDLGYDLMFTVSDADDDAFNLTGSVVTFQMAEEGSTTLKVNSACTLVVAANGTCAYTMVTGDLDTAGEYIAQLKIAITGKIYTIGGMSVVVKDQFYNVE